MDAAIHSHRSLPVSQYDTSFRYVMRLNFMQAAVLDAEFGESTHPLHWSFHVLAEAFTTAPL